MNTTIRVDKTTSRELDILKRKLGLRSINEVIGLLIKEHKKKRLEEMFGIDNIQSFTEEDRIEDRS
jgi:predicted CopG family antitoxin